MTLPQALLRLAAERNYESARAAADAVRAEIREADSEKAAELVRAVLALQDATVKTNDWLADVLGALGGFAPQIPEPRPPTRPGDEFPDGFDSKGFGPRRPILECTKCGDLPMRADLLREQQIGDDCPVVACDGKLRKPSPELPAPDRFESVLGSELRVGDVVLAPFYWLDQSKRWAIEKLNGVAHRVNGTAKRLIGPDMTYSRLVRPAPVEAEKPTALPKRELRFVALGPDRSGESVAPVRVDSLPVGSKCWVEVTVHESTHGPRRRVDISKANDYSSALWIPLDALVLPSEPSPTVASEPLPAPIAGDQLVKGSTLKEGDMIWVGDKRYEVCANYKGYLYYGSDSTPIVPQLGYHLAAPVAPSAPEQKWDRYTVQAFRDRLCKVVPTFTPTIQRVANEMLAEVGVKP